MAIISIIVSVVISYSLGSIMFGVIVSKSLKKQDVRNMGSGNAGMTNVLRNFGSHLAILTAIGDFLKGAAAVYISRLICVNFGNIDYNIAGFIGALAVILGHAFPMFFQLKGGKGVMTGFASIIMIDWQAALIALTIFFVVVIFTRYISLGSVLAASSYPFISLLLKRPIFPNFIGGLILAAFIVFLHKENVKRLMAGTESKFGSKKN